MTEPYPWGSQVPAKRVSTLDGQIKSNDAKRTEAAARHRDEMKRLDEADRSLKADLRIAQGIVDRERTEANAAAATGVLMKLLKSSGIDVDEAIRAGTLESAMAEALAKVAAPKVRKAKPSPPEAEGGPAS